ncbi:hypothetical protein C8R45DRAFT_1010304, partial [Mycena sanguinolenta]
RELSPLPLPLRYTRSSIVCSIPAHRTPPSPPALVPPPSALNHAPGRTCTLAWMHPAPRYSASYQRANECCTTTAGSGGAHHGIKRQSPRQYVPYPRIRCHVMSASQRKYSLPPCSSSLLPPRPHRRPGSSPAHRRSPSHVLICPTLHKSIS